METITESGDIISSVEGYEKKVTTRDGIEFTVSTDDVIELTEKQFNALALNVLRKKAEYIRKDGVDIASLNQDQISNVLSEIKGRLDQSDDPLGENLIRLSEHITDDHALNPNLLQKRGWYRDSVQELYDDIINVIKQADDVRKAKLKFHKIKEQSMPTFTFTVIGIKVDGSQGEVSIAFIKDDSGLILAVTII
ncbi:hypothetical protein QVE09_17875 [Paenibacillus sp. ClWae2A]|uniref:hypothetical protein n=1 Tax=Paenibacillus sp. ClWae2A TaxID=3057177 RepID=UPI0028F51DDB|nr:hypothetical protein [Paenibacillus sp. ClWae2A]MDT9720790.1 hypothetical protein [Paenibacillus sp. ClWae2A]